MTRTSDEEQIRALITHWVTAIQRGDLAGVLDHHAEDIVMFDVPPPERGVRGLGRYSATWSGFFEWIASGAVFDMVELEVRAGKDTAYAFALLRCGTPEDLAGSPEQRLRITLGLVKHAGEWLVQHEHHSFTYTAG
ncbi:MULTISPECIES: YybH family protein [Brevibacterium]|jgi:uncharacterized protein (TIGR02246 family)|uniref:SnoaL-like domain-containing protein n=1 Tax=Brevibacterium salitolerans TaxID=1403566 RepID=A0ABP5IRV3_9MICO|nr:SgcJ/EcaC family oxidoreductase [Brevibacterium sp.]